jgi:hypothetical protein
MSTIFGNFVEAGEGQEYLIISFSSATLPIFEKSHTSLTQSGI